MLIDRSSPGDADKGRALPQDAITKYESLNMVYPAKSANKKLVAL